jgi:hypothetical protein
MGRLMGALLCKARDLFANRGVSRADIISDPDSDSSAVTSGPPAWILVWWLVFMFSWACIEAFHFGRKSAMDFMAIAEGGFVTLILGVSGWLTIHRVGAKFAKAQAANAGDDAPKVDNPDGAK